MSPPALKALIIEDSEDDAELLARTLQRGGYEVTYERVDEAAALQAALKRQHWDITFSDFSVPGFDAMAALALVREHDPDIPLIIVSGTIGEETAVAAMKNGAHDYFIKGNLARLLPAVERELREAERRREHRRGEQARQDSDERFRLLVGGTKDYAIFLLDIGGRVTSWNEGSERVTG
jgi:DNA-binding NtrC family response regulator